MSNLTSPLPFLVFLLTLLILPLAFSPNDGCVLFAEAGKRRVQITDDLDDVVDEEEDDDWKQWGKKSTPSPDFDPPSNDMSNMDLAEIQAEMMKRQSGPAFGFVKLRLGVKRTRDMVSEIAMKWSKVLRTGSIGVKFMGVDLTTIMVSMERGQDTTELKEFVLSQPEAYEFKIGDQVFRRPGDPPLEQVVEKLRKERKEMENESPTESKRNFKEEL